MCYSIRRSHTGIWSSRFLALLTLDCPEQARSVKWAGELLAAVGWTLLEATVFRALGVARLFTPRH